jgi:alpha/beta superfamily hydrolase
MLCASDTLVVESVHFHGGPYRLEGELAYSEARLPVGAALVAGPHPLLGGNLDDNVVRGLGDGLARLGLITLRFNYHGVGGSEGPAADTPAHPAQSWPTLREPDEIRYQPDLVGALGFLHVVVGRALPLVLIGYGFGCTLLPAAVPLVRASDAQALIAPTVGQHDYRAFAAVPNPKLVIAPRDDFAPDAEHILRWFDRLPAPKQLVRPRLEAPFFRGHEDWLVATLDAFFNRERGEAT